MGALWDTFRAMHREMKEEFDAHHLAAYFLAERETNGVLVRKEGTRRGITGLSLFSGPESRAYRWASEELLDHWTRHPRPNLELFEEQWIRHRGTWQ